MIEVRALREGDDRSQFQSGDPDLDRFLYKFAGQNQFRHHVGVTYVAVEDRRILGVATVAPGHVEIEGLRQLAIRRKHRPLAPPIIDHGFYHQSQITSHGFFHEASFALASRLRLTPCSAACMASSRWSSGGIRTRNSPL